MKGSVFFILVLAVGLSTGCALWPWGEKGKEEPKPPVDTSKGTPRTVDIADVETRQDRRWYLKGTTAPYTGKVIRRYENGDVALSMTTQDGLKEGPYTWWHSNGVKQVEVFYRMGRKEGMGREWYVNGQVKRETLYRNDSKVAHKEWLSTGTQKILLDWNVDGSPKKADEETRLVEYSEVEFRTTDGKLTEPGFAEDKRVFVKGETAPLTGQVVDRHANGKKSEEMSVVEGLLDGRSTIWNKEGWREFEYDYRAGKVLRFRAWDREGKPLQIGTQP